MVLWFWVKPLEARVGTTALLRITMNLARLRCIVWRQCCARIPVAVMEPVIQKQGMIIKHNSFIYYSNSLNTVTLNGCTFGGGGGGVYKNYFNDIVLSFPGCWFHNTNT